MQLRELMKAEIEETNKLLRTATGEQLLREQGKAQWLDRFEELIDPKARPQRDPPKRANQPFRDGLTY